MDETFSIEKNSRAKSSDRTDGSDLADAVEAGADLAQTATAELVRRRQIQAVGTAFLRRRPLIVAPAAVVLLLVISHAGVPPHQLIALAALKGAMVTFFLWEAWRYRAREIDSRGLFVSLAVTLAGLSSICAITGGIRSPLVPLLFAPSVLGLAAFGARRAGWLMLALLVLSGLLLAMLPPLAAFPQLPAGAARVAGVAAIVVTVLLFAVGITGLVQAYERTGFALGRIRDQVAIEAESRTRDIAALGARLAHEIKNPLAAIKGLIQLEGRHAVGERSGARFSVMESEIARLEGILADYLTFARPPVDAKVQRVSARSLIRDVLAVLEGRAQASGVRLVQEGDQGGHQDGDEDGKITRDDDGADSGADLCLVADPFLLKQALFNLFANALDATAAGGTIVGRVRRTDEGAAIEVVDTGRGMEPGVLAQIGTPFFSTRHSGTGLGVLIARRIARQHGGDLSFVSRPGQGTTASLSLPLSIAGGIAKVGVVVSVVAAARAGSGPSS